MAVIRCHCGKKYDRATQAHACPLGYHWPKKPPKKETT